ncbi:uncharacterized protein A4U43_C03F29430 [Asparagus officinalis]|uniref:Late embryogenesis abundant protein LEA-2 subgroup domain-containing protein n=1 Tax=Asparagus officinalis TaxID=4686 RepID=A0A5P1FI26_ASPOF|nr:uncharacterized protein LOC109835475 [Asparagus officinalis]ONK76549.1 uncharacterized protein A4U43_C03F29430 [Asparagus officinalis]
MDEKAPSSSKPDHNSNPNPNHRPPRPLNATVTGHVARLVPVAKAYHQPPPPPFRARQRQKNRSCTLFLWLVLLLFALVFIFAIATGVFYVLYHPHRPDYSITSLRFVSFKLSKNQLASSLNLTVIANNQNTKVKFLYSPFSISATYDGVPIGDGYFPAFVHRTGNTTKLKALVEGTGRAIDERMTESLKRKRSLRIKIEMETEVAVKIAGLKTKMIGVRIACAGIEVAVPNGKKRLIPHSNSSKRCDVKLSVQIWKLTF